MFFYDRTGEKIPNNYSGSTNNPHRRAGDEVEDANWRAADSDEIPMSTAGNDVLGF